MTGRLSLADRVLVRVPSWLGDFVMAEPSIRALCERQERSPTTGSVSLAGPARLLELLDGRFPLAHRLPTSEREPESAHPWREHDSAILLDGSFRTARRACSARIPLRAGFASGGRGLLLTHPFTPAAERGGVPLGLGRAGRFPRRMPRPFGAACAELLSWIGAPVASRRPRILASEKARLAIDVRLTRAGLGAGEPFVLANAGARPDSAKRYPAERFAAALDDLAKRLPLPIVIACATGEEENARATAARCALARTILLDQPAVTLPELVALTSAAKLVLGPDSGPRHLAEALDVPCVAVCGPTDPRHTAEHGPRTRVLSVEVPCGPCHREVCPIPGDPNHACMRRLAPADVASAAVELLR